MATAARNVETVDVDPARGCSFRESDLHRVLAVSSNVVNVDGEDWDLAALAKGTGHPTLMSVVSQARNCEVAGPDGLLGVAGRSCSQSQAEARGILKRNFSLTAPRARAAVALGSVLGFTTSTNQPLGYIAGVKMSANQSQSLVQLLVAAGGKSQPVGGSQVSLRAAKQHWDAKRFRLIALAAARSRDIPAMSVAAALGAAMRLHDPLDFARQITTAQSYVVASRGRRSETGRLADRVLACSYAMSSLDAAGMDLGGTRWHSASPSWRLKAAPWVFSVLDGANGAAVSALLDAVHARKLSFVPLGSHPFGFLDSQTELTDVLLRARAYEDRLTKWFTEPMWFDGGPGGIQVLVTQDEDRYMYAWVGVDGTGLLVTFDTVDLLGYGLDEPGVRAGLALAIGWFLDISVSLRNTPGGTGTIRRTSTGTTPATGWSYVPTPRFANQRAGVSVGAAPRMHGVIAHLRTLAAGQTPSPDARSRAPRRLRDRMKKNQTFVRAHFRGQAYRGNLDARLSKYSALADVLAGLERHP